ncbi:MAG TPA: hypothetical protein VK116_15295 [Planctomycetota bacterium]|nr:hypothetical protein [Planctomycetota bacterium]
MAKKDSARLHREAIEQTLESILASFGGDLATVEKNLRSTIEPLPVARETVRLDRLKRDLAAGGERFVAESVLGKAGWAWSTSPSKRRSAARSP